MLAYTTHDEASENQRLSISSRNCGRVHFALTHKNDQTVFSFQIPSTHEYDFVKQIDQGVGQKKVRKKK